ncbi:hypothetical protein ACEPAF_3716 [Sanghuangporus sanghuang]
MPPKKRKTQLKKVERGYATTSIPKKVLPPVPASEETTEPAAEQINSSNPGSNAPEPVHDESLAYLQSLVDKYQEKVEKEVQRTLKSIEYDRRMAKGLPQVDIDEGTLNEIMQLIEQEESEKDIAKLPSSSREKLTGQIGITYGVLRRLGFAEQIVCKCLKEAPGIDLDQAFDWLHVHCSPEELEFEKFSGDASGRTPLTPQTPDPDPASTPGTPKKLKKPLPLSSSSMPSKLEGASVPENRTSASATHETVIEDASDIDDPNAEYVRLKLQITDLTGNRRLANEIADEEFLRKLRGRLESVKKNYFFSEKDAEASFKSKRREADEALLLARLRGEVAPAPKPIKRDKVEVPQPPEKPKGIQSSEDVFDDLADDDSDGGIFGILEPMPTSITSAEGTTIAVRDMALPKQWAGRTPRSLLQDFVLKSDRFAAISYNELSAGNRAKRASVNIRWTGGRASDWSMEDVACHDLIQAEQYIATVALHSLTYPSDEGFRNSSGNLKGAQTSYRHLPPAFRELWNGLEAKRREDEDRANREVWGSLNSILESRLSGTLKSEDRALRELSPEVTLRLRDRTTTDYFSEHLRAGFLARRSSLAYQEMLVQRNTLPIASYRNVIMEMLEMSQVIVLSGETGCGKSTQLPSFVLEDQLSKGRHCKIVVTEPRRISAISLAQRVSRELGDPPGAVGTNSSLVGYSIRLESQTSKNTRLNFVTNGIALRMLEGGSGTDGQGTAFDEITHIVVDEVHERSIDSDFLLIVLKSLLQERRDLKVVLMSATLNAEKISQYFGGCPTIEVPGRTFPVDVHFLEDAVEYAQWIISESSPYAKRVHDKFHRNKKTDWSEDFARNIDEDEDDETPQGVVKFQGRRYSPSTIQTMNLLDERQIPYDLIIGILERMCNDPALSHLSSAFLIFMPGLGEIRRLNDMLVEHAFFGSDAFQVFPLHSTISSENQSLVFESPPLGVRKIVIATNIAETGITIPDITCVIDSGKHREMRFDEKRQISRLIETFIARSNATQRRGRAGRVQSGICFHLFSRARHDLMAEHPLPEMLRLSLSDLALRIKILKVNLGSSIEDVLTKSLDPPSSINIQRAKAALIEVGALTPTEDITPMGRLLSKLPTDVHLGKFLLIAALFSCLDPALTIAATLNSKSPFVTPFGLEQEADRAKNSFKIGNSDFLTIHYAFSSWRKASGNPNFVRKFCRQNFLSPQNLQQIEDLRQQFLGYLIDSSFIKVDKEFIQELNRSRYSRGYRTRFVPVPTDYDRNNNESMLLLNAALCAGLYPKLLSLQDSANGQQLRILGNNQTVAFHPSSVNFGRRPQDFGVNYLCYFTIMQSKRLYAWETGPVDDIAIILLCGECEFKLIANTVIIDRKIRYRLNPKTSITLKYLRSNLTTNLAAQFRGKVLTEQQQKWKELAMRVLSKMKVEEPITIANGLGIILH